MSNQKGFTPIVILILVSLIAISLLSFRFLAGGDEDTWLCQNGQWVKHGNPTQSRPEEPCTDKNQGTTVSGQAATPEKVVETFYSWYLGQKDNPLSTGAYKEQKALSDSFKLKVDQIVAAFEGGGYDPIVCAQDLPSSIKVGSPKVEGEWSRVTVNTYFGQTAKTLEVALQKINGEWKISDVTCEDKSEVVEGETKTAIVYYSNPRRSAGSTECGLVFGVERQVSNDAGYEDLLNILFLGPTASEKQQGYSSFFSKSTANILKSVKVVGTTAYVDLKDIRTVIPNASASCGSQDFFASVGETLKHDRKITKVIYAIEGNPETFYEWMQLGCQPENNNCDKTPFK